MAKPSTPAARAAAALDADTAYEQHAARRADAEVSFKVDIFLRELAYNVFVFLALPLVLARHGRIGSRNRMFTGYHGAAIAQSFWSLAMLAINVLHGLYGGSAGYPVTAFEVVLVDLLYVLRCMTIAVKYAHYSDAELRELDTVELPPHALNEKLVLVGWMRPSPHLLYHELERAIIRKVPNMCSHKVLYADRCTRDAMLWSMKAALPSYLKYELDVDVEEEAREEEEAVQGEKAARAAEAQKRVDDSTTPNGRVVVVSNAEDIVRLGLPPDLAALATAALQKAGGSATTAAPAPAASDAAAVNPLQTALAGDDCCADAPEGVAQVDMSLEARAVRRLIQWMDDGDDSFTQVDVNAVMQKAVRRSMAGEAGDAASTMSASSRSMSGAGEDDRPPTDTPSRTGPMRLRTAASKRVPPPPARKVDGDASCAADCRQSLSYIPGKLFAWFIIHSTHSGTYGTSIMPISYVVSIIFAFIPILSRAGFGHAPFGSMWAAYVVEILLTYQLMLNFGVTVRYMLVSPVDFSRRLQAMTMLDSVIDANSPVATEFAMPTMQTGGALRSRQDGGDPAGVMQLMDIANLPMSKIATERQQQLEQAQHGDSVIVRHADSEGGMMMTMDRRRASTLNAGARGSSNAAGSRNASVTASGGNDAVAAAAAAAALKQDGRQSVRAASNAAFSAALQMVGGTAAAMAAMESPSAMAAASTRAPVPKADLSLVAGTASDGGRIQGWLTKRSLRPQASTGFFAALAANSWKRRYFIGDSVKLTLTYYPCPGAMPIHALQLTHTTRVYSTSEHYRAHEFAVQFDDSPPAGGAAAAGAEDEGQTLFVCAPSESTKDTWMAFLSGMIVRCQQQRRQEQAAAAAAAAAQAASRAAEDAARARAAAIATEMEEEEEADDELLLTLEGEQAHIGVDVNDRSSTAGNGRSNTVRDSILARHRLFSITSAAQTESAKVYMPVLYGENLVSWFSCRQLVMDFGESFRLRIQLYTAFFAVVVVAAIILLFMNFVRSAADPSQQVTMLAMVALGQITFSVGLACAIVYGSQLNDMVTYHRFRLSRIETLICDFLVASTTAVATPGRGVPWKAVHDSPMQRQLRLTRQVASSIGQSLVTESAVVPARVLFMPANMALLSTFWSLSISGTLSAVRALGI